MKASISLEQAETGIFGSTHAQVGAYLLALWGLPDSVVRAVECHHSFERTPSSFTPALAVHIAQSLEPGAGRSDELESEILREMGLADRVSDWQELLRGE